MTIHINIDTLGDVHPIAILRQTRLVASCQGKAEVGQIAIRDIGQTRESFPLGKRVTVVKDGFPTVYGGYLIRARRRFFFDVDKPDALQRLWILDVVSNDILFQKRIVAKLSDPKQISGPVYSTDTLDTVIIDELVSNWLDLSADGIDVTSKVHTVSWSNAGQPTYPINGSMQWGQAMQIIANLPAAVFGLTPDWELYYGDVDEEDAPFALAPRSDTVVTTDGFSRVVGGNSWGSGDFGDWVPWDPADVGYSVDGTKGVFTTTVEDTLDQQVVIPEAAREANAWKVQHRFMWPDALGTFPFYELDIHSKLHAPSAYDTDLLIYLEYEGDGTVYFECGYVFNDGGSFIDGDTITPSAVTPGAWANVIFEWLIDFGIIRAKYWLDGDDEPDWLVVHTGVVGDTGTSNWPQPTIEIEINGETPSFTTYVDDMVFTAGMDIGAVAGYREATIIDDFMQGANDFLGIGFGKGVRHGVHAREIDAASVAEHGLWQDAMVHYAVWKQETIDRIADRAVNGSPLSKRGRKDPRVLVEAVTYEDGLRPGMKVRFVDSTHNFDDVIPIRSMELTFPTPDDIRYELKLSHEIDAAWNTMDPVPFIPLPPAGVVPIYDVPIVIPEIEDGPRECQCGITDTFQRTTVPWDGSYTTGNGWGQSDEGTTWGGSAVSTYVNGAAGVLSIGTPAQQPTAFGFETTHIFGQQAFLNWGYEAPMNLLLEMRLNRALIGDTTGDPDLNGEYFWIFGGDGPPFNSPGGKFVIVFSGEFGLYMDGWDDAVGPTTPVSLAGIDMTQPFKVRITGTGPGQPWNVYVWQSTDDEPGTPTTSLTGITFSNHGLTIELVTDNASASPLQLYMNSLDAAGVTRCGAYGLDEEFALPIASGWGTGWTAFGSASGVSVAGGKGIMTYPASPTSPGSLFQHTTGDGAWSGDHTVTLKFQTSGVDSTTCSRLMAQYIDSAGTSGAQVFCDISSTIGQLGINASGGTTVAKNDWVAATDYYLKIERTLAGELIKMKVWKASDPEPSSWDIEATGWTATNPLGPSSWFAVTWTRGRGTGVFDTGPSRTLSVDSIVFSGHACFPCSNYMSGTMWEDFSRADDDEWGSPTPGPFTFPWNTDPGSDDVYGPGEAKISGGKGILRAPPLPEPTDPTGDHDSVGPSPEVSIFSAAVIPATPSSFSMRMKLQMRSQDTECLQTTPFLTMNFGAIGVTIEVGHPVDDDTGRGLEVSAAGRPASFIRVSQFLLQTGYWYYMRLEQLWQQYWRIKFWKVDEGEPANWLAQGSTAGQTTSLGGQISFFIQSGGNFYGSNENIDAFEVWFDDIEFAVVSTDCDGQSSNEIPSEGRFCEVAEFVDGFTYNTSVRFKPNSQTVRVNGLLAHPVSIADPDGQYTVSVDRTSIVMTDPYDFSDVVEICYDVD